MGQPSAMLDFFVLEASDYLERLDTLAQARAGSAPSGDEFVRLARAFRGSALMANQQVMARAAQGLEAAARGVRDGRLEWTERVRSEVVRAVDDCKILLRRVRTPEAGDAQRAEAIGLGLERMAGRPSTAVRAHVEGLDAGGRAFVGREAASIASTLDRVARTLGMDPGARDALNGIAPAMSQLRGVAILNDLPPLADVLAAVDGAVRLVHATPGPVPTQAAAVFDAAARTLARAAREVVDVGRPAPSSEESRAFTAGLLRTFITVGDPVPIELLAADDAGSGIVTAGTPPVEGAAPPRVELVSQGEFLSAAASELGRAGSEVQRDLRLFVIGASLKPLIEADGSALARALAAFAEAGWWAIGTGAAAAEPERFVEVVSDAAATLRGADVADEWRIAQMLAAHASRLLLRLPFPPPAAAPVRPAAAPVVAGAPVTDLPAAPAAVRSTAVRPLPPTVPSEGGGLAASWSTLEALIAERGLAPGPLEEFLAAPVTVRVSAAAPVREAALPAAAPAVPAAAAEPPIVPVEKVARGLRASWSTLEARILERAFAPGPMEEVSAAPAEAPVPAVAPVEGAPAPVMPEATAEPPIVPIESLAPGELEVVPIESLLYDSDGARARLREVRGELDAALATAGTSAQVRALLGEVFDLIALGFHAAR
jgi:hypothetical protein